MEPVLIYRFDYNNTRLSHLGARPFGEGQVDFLDSLYGSPSSVALLPTPKESWKTITVGKRLSNLTSPVYFILHFQNMVVVR